jgi:type II secretory ATPase GspE/PulE/Tfp pilus assembly ATPase PilB-like protein
MLAEILVPNQQRIRRAIRAHADVVRLEQIARRSGMLGLAERALNAIQSGLTDPAEFRRVLGIWSTPTPTSK